MSVLKSKRGVSCMEFYHNALALRKYVTFRLLKDFGIKNTVRDKVHFLHTENLSDIDKKKLCELLQQCDYNATIEEYPAWFISREREYISDLCRKLIAYITSANAIYITNEQESTQRRQLQNLAIATVEILIQELTFITEIIPSTQADQLKPFIEMSTREIALLKGWRKSDNKVRKSLGIS